MYQTRNKDIRAFKPLETYLNRKQHSRTEKRSTCRNQSKQVLTRYRKTLTIQTTGVPIVPMRCIFTRHQEKQKSVLPPACTRPAASPSSRGVSKIKCHISF